jgi:hypothetical protein
MTIREATEEACIFNQLEARACYAHMVSNIERGRVDAAKRDQDFIAYHHREAWKRLERLLDIG